MTRARRFLASKRHIACGHPRIALCGGSDHGRGDGSQGCAAGAQTRQARPVGRVLSLPADAGYASAPFVQGGRDILGEHVTVQIAKRSELHTFKIMLKR